jgi:hypothetical protein
MEKQRRFNSVLGFLSDFLFFVYINARHYGKALWGFRLRIDPDYPKVTRFFPTFITDTVLEYRSYAFLALWGAVLSPFADSFGLWLLIATWAVQSFFRAEAYESPLNFWGTAWAENPRKSRVVMRYAENVLMEIERQMKAGKTMEECQGLIDLGMQLVDDVATKPMSPITRPDPKF